MRIAEQAPFLIDKIAVRSGAALVVFVDARSGCAFLCLTSERFAISTARRTNEVASIRKRVDGTAAATPVPTTVDVGCKYMGLGLSAFVAVGSTATDELKKQVMEHHWALRRELPSLETLAWNEARSMTSLQTVQMMRALEALKTETIRHLKFAEVLVHPFVGQARADGLYRSHVADQRVVEKALDGAVAAARGEMLRTALAEVRRRIEELFGLERLFGAVPRR